MSPQYPNQLSRIKRYFAKFQQINNGVQYDDSSLEHEDVLYGFFQNCYHLKDWIKHDPACSGWTDIEDAINANQDMQFCADLCNGTKHLELRRSRSGQDPKFTGGVLTLRVTDGFGVQERVDISRRYTVSASSGELDAFELAGRCMNFWDQYIRDNGGTP